MALPSLLLIYNVEVLFRLNGDSESDSVGSADIRRQNFSDAPSSLFQTETDGARKCEPDFVVKCKLRPFPVEAFRVLFVNFPKVHI